MKRRRFLSSIAIIIPSILGSSELLTSCNQAVEDNSFSPENIALLDEIGETIIPSTKTSPGAKAARIGEFIKVYVTDCYDKNEQQIFWSGIQRVKQISKEKFNNSFSKLAVSQKQMVLKILEKEPAGNIDNNKNVAGSGDAVQTGKSQQTKATANSNSPHFFSMLNQLVVFGYFTSKPGASQALRYIQTPGSYQGEVPYKKGEKSWAT